MPKLYIEEKYCKGCGICIEFCPAKVLKTSKKMNSRGYFPPESSGDGKVQKVRNVLAPMPGLRYRRFRLT